MSNLLSQASLVMIPSGYKEDVVYSAIPTNGNGDLSFTRASNGTRVNSSGLVEVCPWNLLQQSETIGVSPWVLGGVTITTNATTAPNGTSTAEKIIENTSNGYHQVYQEIFASGSVVGQDYTFSCYAKASERTKISLALQTPNVSVATFDLINGTASITDGSGTAGVAIESVGNGWYRCSIYRLNTTTGYIYGNLQMNNGTVTIYTGDGTSGVFVWGAQLNIGSTAKPYFPTTDRLNVPRLTYQNGGGGCPSLLLEKQSTNLQVYSEQFDLWSTTSDLSVTANNTTSPDGTQNADKLNENSSNGYHIIGDSNITLLASTVYTSSFFAKASERSYARMLAPASNYASQSAYFDLTNGNCSATAGTVSTQSMGNGWYRCIWTLTTSSSVSGGIGMWFGPARNMTDAYNTYTGTNGSGIFAWGAQIEQSSYPTSYIVSTSSSATRVADLDTSDTIQTAQTFAGDFTIFADFVPFIDSTDANGLMILGGGASGLGATYRSYLWFVGSNVYLSGDSEINIIQRGYSMVVNQRVKIAFTRVGTTVKMFVNGAQVGASATSSTSITIRSIGWSYNLPTYQTKGKINQILLSATGASDADAISLTTL